MRRVLFIYEENATIRERLYSYFSSTSWQVVACYSIENLKLNFNKYCSATTPLNESAVLCEMTRSPDFIKESSIRLFSYNHKTLDESQLKRLKEDLENWFGSILTVDTKHFDFLIIGSSTGGFPLVKEIVSHLKLEKSSVIVCQHINEELAEQLLKSLNAYKYKNFDLVDREIPLQAGRVYFLRGGRDYSFTRRYEKISLRPDVSCGSFFHPSVDCLLKNVPTLKEYKFGVVILSGLGEDGSKYLPELVAENVEVLVQEPTEAVAPGMPQAALARSNKIKPLKAKELVEFIKSKVA